MASSNLRIAVTGASGQLGLELCRQLGRQAIPLNHPEFDLTDTVSIDRAIAAWQPDVVINCAAYTKVDQAEQEADQCAAINADAVAVLAQACIRADCALVQISTDYVFGGDVARKVPYRECDLPAPQGVYARTKLAGERHAAACPRHFIVRTCGLYGHTPQRGNFVETMLRLGAERDHLRIVADQHCTPTFVADLARSILFLIESKAYGSYHVVNTGATTWHEFATEIFRQSQIEISLEKMTTEQFGAAAPRPRYSVLDTTKYAALGGPKLPLWKTALAEYLMTRRDLQAK